MNHVLENLSGGCGSCDLAQVRYLALEHETEINSIQRCTTCLGIAKTKTGTTSIPKPQNPPKSIQKEAN